MHEIRSIVSTPGGRQLIAPKDRRKPKAAEGSLSGVAIPRTEARRSDQRREDRHLRVADQAVLTFRRKKHDVVVLNISGHGAMIETDIMPRIGEAIVIQLGDCNRTHCNVRWVRDGRIGVEFRDETVVFGPKSVQGQIFGDVEGEDGGNVVSIRSNRPVRHSFIWRGTLYWKGGALDARLRNISADGAMIESDRDLEEGSEVVLDLGPAGTAPGIVRWCRSAQIGVAFNDKFDMSGLAAARPAGESSPQMVKPAYLESDGKADSPWANDWEKFTPDKLG